MKNCKNCKHFGMFDYCHHHLTHFPEDRIKANYDNNCKYYKRKFWKFWIK